MNGPDIQWANELLRATAALSISALIVAALAKLLKIASPSAHRLACFLVLLQGWLIVHPTLELPWGEPRPSVARAVDDTRLAGAPADPARVTATIVNGTNAFDASPVAAEGAPQSRPAQPQSGRGWRVVGVRVGLAIWAAGGFATLALLAASYWRFVRRVGGWLPAAPEWVDEWRQALAEQPALRRVDFRVTATAGPLVCWTPSGSRVLVPEDLWRDLNAMQRLAVLRHELAHCRRGDLWKSLAVRLLAAPHWFNPLAWRAVRRFDDAAEWACDALAPRTEQERLEYAKVLLRLCRSTPAGWPVAAAVGGRAMTARVGRILSPNGNADAWPRKTALGVCATALILLACVRVEVVARAAAPPPATDNEDQSPDGEEPRQKAAPADRKSPVAVDASFLDLLARLEAKFAVCHIEYRSTPQPANPDDPPSEKQERIEFARDGAGRSFRKATETTNGARTRQYDFYTEQDGKRAVNSMQHNWNGLNPPSVGISAPEPYSRHDYDAAPIFGLFPNSKPLSSMLKDQEVNVEIVEGDALLSWTETSGDFKLRYEVRLSTEHEFMPVRYKYSVNERSVYDWRITQWGQAEGVWYAAEGELNTPTRSQFKTTRFDLGKRLPEEAMSYVIPDGARVHDGILNKNYTQGRPVTKKMKPLAVRVRDVANRPVAAATVKVTPYSSSRDEAEPAPVVKLTDAEGEAHFDAVPDDVLGLNVSQDGMRPATIILGDGQEIMMYLTPLTTGTVADAAGRPPQNAFVHTVTQGFEMSQGAIKRPPTEGRDSAAVAADGSFEYTQDLTLRRLNEPLMFVAYAEDGRRMAIRAVMPQELLKPLHFVLQPAALVAVEFELPAGAPAATQIGALWTDPHGRRIAYSQAEMHGDVAAGPRRGEMTVRFPPGKYQLRMSGTAETESSVVDFVVRPTQTEVSLGAISLQPSKFAALRGQPAPELAGKPMPPSELKPLSALRGQVVVLNFWRWAGDKLNDHPEQTPFFILPAQFKDRPVYWIAIHDHHVHDPEALAAKVAGIRKSLWGEGRAPFMSLIDDSEPVPMPEDAAERTATSGWEPGSTRSVTRARYGVYELVLIDGEGRVVGNYSQEELEPALRRLLAAQK
ncbi:MAG TPA: M56 family metallopeptidase [Pirellulales bacterium]|jgi:beta-lactamase regulating signal transducer with metallopeptidase domain|nr:M56 family metallopeptidase [Pirellulales bacterium]